MKSHGDKNEGVNRTKYMRFYPFVSTGKERDEETGYNYHGARFYDAALLAGWLSVDPLADKYPSISPYNYCAWNPIKLVDPDGKDIYRLDVESGSLMLYKKTKDKIDYIESGSYVNHGREKNVWEKHNRLYIHKGVLNGKKNEDLSKKGFTTTGGNQRDGLRAAKFISFQCHRELGGAGFSSEFGDELDVHGWAGNTPFEANRTDALDRYTHYAKLQFDFHTHPGDKYGNGGHAKRLDDADRMCAHQNRQLYNIYQNYIISQKDGVVSYNEWNIIPTGIGILPQSFSGL